METGETVSDSLRVALALNGEPEVFDAGIRAIQRTTAADGVFCYTFFKGVAVVGDRRNRVGLS